MTAEDEQLRNQRRLNRLRSYLLLIMLLLPGSCALLALTLLVEAGPLRWIAALLWAALLGAVGLFSVRAWALLREVASEREAEEA